MKRDMALIRKLLFAIEDEAEREDLLKVDDRDEREIKHHLKIMGQNGLIEIELIEVTGRDGQDYLIGPIGGLTWEGHDFADAVRSDKVWRRVWGGIKKTTGTTTIDVIKTAAQKVAVSRLSQAIPELLLNTAS